MEKLDHTVAASVIGLATFSVWQVWQNAAPSLKELRAAHPGDHAMRTSLQDADVIVGGLTVLVAITMAWYTRDKSVILLMLLSFGILSLWSHMVLNSTALKPEN